MVGVYVYMIKSGKMTFEQIPERWREEVRKVIENDG